MDDGSQSGARAPPSQPAPLGFRLIDRLKVTETPNGAQCLYTVSYPSHVCSRALNGGGVDA
jgi:hypothetical protein